MTLLLPFLVGAVTLSYLLAALFFLRFWTRTRDRLLLSFGIAFLLLAANQAAAFSLGQDDERTGWTYILRVLGFLLILGAIVAENVGSRRRS